ncbi:alpha/beta fold hydrolase [Aeromicrobium piscarium]|uniref:Alpha/beta fold hydrolase n=1 Tax=Aeromicrobium piscarium TaxID=2590901 RepID=A0A554SGN0_9ACTN|nr:alpha/beta fold hydrolase [Aeromicrobium piscarium]TSD65502.1 alpha/beta fold hydrolase [Aeromicrobium piscarium]
MTDRFARSPDGTMLGYEVAGDPALPTLLLLHSLGADRGMWGRCRALLQEQYRLILPDTRGHGSSEAATEQSVTSWTEDLVAILDDADADRCTVVGVSLGGIQAIVLAAHRPERVRGMVVADSFVGLDADVAVAKIASSVEQARTLSMPAVADRYLADTFREPYPPDAEAVRRAIAQMDRDSYIAAVEACFGIDIRDLLGRIAAPARVVWGDRDQKTPRPLSEEIVAGLARADLVVLPDAGHLSNADNPGDFAAEVHAFCEQLDAAAAKE